MVVRLDIDALEQTANHAAVSEQHRACPCQLMRMQTLPICILPIIAIKH